MSRATSSARFSTEPVDVVDLGRIDYLAALERQRALAAERAEDRGRDTLLLLEHPPVYTAGRRTAPEDLPSDGTPVIDVDRGGKLTWHGPGQLVGYPIIKLAEPVDVVDYVRRLEEAMIAICASFGVSTGRVEGRSGVWLAGSRVDGPRGVQWLPERKIGAIGVRVQRGVTLHGFAINCNADLAAFESIIPCGIADAGVTSLSVESGREVTVEEIKPLASAAIRDALEGRLPVTEHTIERLTFDDLAPAQLPPVTTIKFG